MPKRDRSKRESTRSSALSYKDRTRTLADSKMYFFGVLVMVLVSHGHILDRHCRGWRCRIWMIMFIRPTAGNDGPTFGRPYGDRSHMTYGLVGIGQRPERPRSTRMTPERTIGRRRTS